MNNWRLLLLAVVAVFQPIATFTERNLVDGRQQCCDRQPTTSLLDTKSSLHGHRYTETTSPLRLLNDRNEIHEDRRKELRQRKPLLNRLSSDRPLRDIKERAVRQGPTEIARSTRVESRLERSANGHSRGRLLEVNDRERTFKNRRVVKDTSRDDEDRRNIRGNDEPLRFALTRKENSASRFSNEQLSKDKFSPQIEMQGESRLRELRFAPSIETRAVFRQTRDNTATRKSIYLNSRHFVERLHVARRETSARLNTRRNIDNNERQQERHGDQWRIVSGNNRLIERIRLDSREENKENRLSSTQRSPTERFDRSQKIENFRDAELTRKSVKPSFDLERVQETRRNNRESRTRDVNARDDRRENIYRRMSQRIERINNPGSKINRIQVDSRREVRDEKMSRDSLQMDRINIRDARNALNDRNVDDRREVKVERMVRVVMPNKRENPDRQMSLQRFEVDRTNTREARTMNILNERNIDDRRELIRDKRMLRDVWENTDRRLSREKLQLERRNTREASIRNILNERNVDDRREAIDVKMSRDVRAEKKETADRRMYREKLQMKHKNTNKASIRIILNKRNVDDRREVSDRRMLRDIRENTDRRVSSVRLQLEQRNTRRASIRNILNERNVDDRREARNERMFRESRENTDRRMSRDTLQMEQRNSRESIMRNILNERNINDRREVRNDRISREVSAGSRKNTDQRMSRERSQVERRNARESRLINTLNERNVNDRREVRDERLARDVRADEREKTDRQMGRVTSQVERRNIRESRIMNNLKERNVDDRREVRDERMVRDVRANKRENTDRLISRERLQVERGIVLEARNRNTLNDRNDDDRREIRVERIARDVRADNRENSDRRMPRERQMERRHAHEARITHTLNDRNVDDRREVRDERMVREARANSPVNVDSESRKRVQVEQRYNRDSGIMNTRIGRNIVSRREVRERLSRDDPRENTERRLSREDRQMDKRNIRVPSNNDITQNEGFISQLIRERRSESRLNGVFIAEREDFKSDRKARSVDRKNFREIRAEPTRSTKLVRDNSENRDREEIVARSRNTRAITSMNGKTEIEGDSFIGTWQYVLYSLQGAYLCALFIQMMTPNFPQKDKIMTHWLPESTYYNPIKVD